MNVKRACEIMWFDIVTAIELFWDLLKFVIKGILVLIGIITSIFVISVVGMFIFCFTESFIQCKTGSEVLAFFGSWGSIIFVGVILFLIARFIYLVFTE